MTEQRESTGGITMHTPLTVHTADSTRKGFDIQDSDGNLIAWNMKDGEAAALIVRAVNSHEALIRAIRIQVAINELGVTQKAAKAIGEDAEDALLSGGSLGLSKWAKAQMTEALKLAEG